jgi:hypothetical protein
MIRIQRSRGTPIRPNRGTAERRVRVTRSLVEQVRIRFPKDGSSIEGRSVVVAGTGNPGHKILLQMPGLPDQTAEVGADHAWTMSEVKLPSGEHSLAVTDTTAEQVSREARFTVESLRPIAVVSPLEGETMEAKKIELTGKASPGKLVSLRLPGLKTAVERAGDRGTFRFTDVEFVNWGAQRLSLFYAEDPGEGATEITLDWPGLDLPSVVDPVTREPLKPGSDVVRCTACYTYCYRATWQRMRTCPRCTNATEFWDRRDAAFKVPRVQIGQQGGQSGAP